MTQTPKFRPSRIAVARASLLACLAAMAAILGGIGAARAQDRPAVPREIDRVVAVINSDVVTASELRLRAESVRRQLRRQNIEIPPDDVMEKQVLERLITDRAQTQAARESGIRIDEAQVDRALATIAAQNRLSLQQLRERLEREGVSMTMFRTDIRDEIMIQRLREREVDAKVQISEADVDAWLAEQQTSGASEPVEYNLSHILLRIPEGASPEQIGRQRFRGEEILKQLERGVDFGRLAASFSDAPEAMQGGALGWRREDRLPKLFADAIAPLRPGQTTALLRSPNGFHVLKLLDRRGSPTPRALGGPVRQTRARHILIRQSELITEAEALRRLNEIRERVDKGAARFEDMARQYSSDASAANGGDLGWVYQGDTVPEFERAMDALAPGAISAPVRTPFGWHLIQVIERRTDEASPDRVRQQARMALRERRADEAYQEWLRQLRDRTYVEYKRD